MRQQKKSYPVAFAVAAALAGLCCESAEAGSTDAGNSTDSGKPQANAAATPPVTLEEVVVATNRYDATNIQMNAPNAVSVLSAEDLANTAVHNAAEALGLLPGVNVLSTTPSSFVGGIDGAARGEGMFASVRGMNAEFNINLINGVEVAQGTAYSREVQLSLLPPSGLKTVILNKTSRADMDGDAIGGTVDFRTPTAFDYGGPEGSITVGTRLESRDLQYQGGKPGLNIDGDIARRFGSDGQVGVFAEAYYDLRYFANSEMGGVMEAQCCDNAWAFAVANADGTNPSNINPQKNLELTGINVGVASGFTRRFGGNLSLDWKPDDTTSAYMKLTYAYALTDQESHLSQIIGMGVLQGAAGGANPFEIGTTGLYQPDIANVSIRYWYETNPEVAELGTFQLGGDKKFGRLTLSPNVFFSWGRDDRPDHIEIDARTSSTQGGDITNNGFPYGQTSLFTYSNGFPMPQLTPAMSAQLNNILGLPAFDRGELQAGYSGQVKGGGRLDARVDVGDGLLQYVKFGVKVVDSERHISFRDWTNPGYSGGTFGSLPIWNGAYSPVFPGKYGWSVPNVNQPALFAYYQGAASPNNLDTCGSIYLNSLNCNTQRASETVYSGYVTAQLRSGDWEIVPGLRYEYTYIHNIFWLTPDDTSGNALTGHFSDNDSTFNELLPSIFVNYRPNEGAVYRAGIWTSYTRPAFAKLGGGETVTPSASGATQITEGNPDLKATTAINYDLSGEWDNGAGRHLVVSGFFKTLNHYIYDTVNGELDLNSNVTKPLNGGSGKVGGLELGARQKFTWLPAPFDGFGISGNLTREYTAVHLNVAGLDAVERIENAPDWLGNVEGFYERRGLQLGVIYNYSGSYLAQYDYLSQHSSWDDLWVRSHGRLDVHAGYAFQSGVKLDASVANVLRQYTYWSHIGRDTLADSDIVDSGLSALFNVTYKF